MGLRDNIDVLRRRWRVVALITVLGVAGTGLLSMLATPVYTARASTFFALDIGSTVNEIQQGATFTREQMGSYASLATTPAVLEPVIATLGLDTDVPTLAGQVTASAPNGTVVLDVAVSDTSPELAARVANAVSESLTEVVEGIGPQNDQALPTVRGTMIEPAVAPGFASSPNTRLNVIAGAIGGLLLGIALAFVTEALDTRVRGVRELRLVTDAPVLGRLTREVDPVAGPVVLRRARGPEAEEYRQLASNVQFLRPVDGPLTIVVSSVGADEGASTVAVNLALALAEVSERVLLVDGDLRNPGVADRLNFDNAAGLSTVLAGRAGFADVVEQWGPRGLSVLTSGPVPPNPTQLLSSGTMTTLSAELAQRFDVVVHDSTPVLGVTDALLLARGVDGVILVADTQRLRRPELSEALDALGRADVRLLGVALTVAAGGKQAWRRRNSTTDNSPRWLLASRPPSTAVAAGAPSSTSKVGSGSASRMGTPRATAPGKG